MKASISRGRGGFVKVMGCLFGTVVCCFSAVYDSVAQTPPVSYGATPTQRQLDWHALEYYGFVHFGHNTFTDEEWGWSQSSVDVFNPTNLDTDQWAREFRDAGMTMMILTAKHHDGMALWGTSTTDYNVTNSSWAQTRQSQGLDTDVVRMAAESAEKYGIKFGVYLSPWDMSRDPSVSKGSNASEVGDQIFGDFNGGPSDDFGGDYNAYYNAQLTELLAMQIDDGNGGTKPIEIGQVWLDGASGSSTQQTFDFDLFRSTVRTHQPNAILWGHQGVDARWVGNEEGLTKETNWHTLNVTQPDDRGDFLPGHELEVGHRNGPYWTPAEADARLRGGWFYHENESPKSQERLMRMYLESVGRSVTLLLDVPPNPDGVVVQEDIDALQGLRTAVTNLLGRDVSTNQATASASGVRQGHEMFAASNVIDSDEDTYWTMDDGSLTGSFEIQLPRESIVDAFVVQEHIALGQRIGGYAIDAFLDGQYQTVVSGTSLGYKRIDTLDAPVQTDRIRFRVTQADAVPLISNFQVLGLPILGPVGDVNLDGVVNESDLQELQSGWLTTGVPGEVTWRQGDLNLDGVTDLADVLLMHQALLQAGVDAPFNLAHVPEPCSALIATIAIALVRARKVAPSVLGCISFDPSKW